MSENKRGRPLEHGEPTVPFAVRLPQSQYDQLMRNSLRRDVPAADIARAALADYVSKNCQKA